MVPLHRNILFVVLVIKSVLRDEKNLLSPSVSFFFFFKPPQICEALLLSLIGAVCGDDIVKYGELHAGLVFVL